MKSHEVEKAAMKQATYDTKSTQNPLLFLPAEYTPEIETTYIKTTSPTLSMLSFNDGLKRNSAALHCV